MNNILMSSRISFIHNIHFELNKVCRDNMYYSITTYKRISSFQINWITKHGPIKTIVNPKKLLMFKTKINGKTYYSDRILSVQMLVETNCTHYTKN